MILAVPRQKGDATPGDLAEGNLVAGRAVGRLDPRLVRVLDERIEAGSPENADLGAQLICHAAPCSRPGFGVIPSSSGVAAVECSAAERRSRIGWVLAVEV